MERDPHPAHFKRVILDLQDAGRLLFGADPGGGLSLTLKGAELADRWLDAEPESRAAARMAVELGVSQRPFIMAVAYAASLDFSTPTGYQTNLLVYGPGGYKFADYVKFGGPLNLLLWALAVVLIPQVFPF